MTFDPISYVYIPTVPYSKSTKSDQKTTKHIGGTASKKSQYIQPGTAVLDSLRPSIVEAAERNRGESRVQGEFLVLVFLYKTIADSWWLQAETATPNSTKYNNDFPSIKEVLYTVLQERGCSLVGEYSSIVNTSRGEGKEAPI